MLPFNNFYYISKLPKLNPKFKKKTKKQKNKLILLKIHKKI
jgi:hypothetical protein